MGRQDAKDMLTCALRFREQNADVYEHLLTWARTRAANDLPITAERMSLEVEDLACLKHSNGANKSFPHALRAPLIRLLMQDAPEIRSHVRISTSKVDAAFDFLRLREKDASKALAGTEKFLGGVS